MVATQRANSTPNLKYEVIIYWSQEDQAFIAEVPELPGCAADGRTHRETLANAEVIIREWIETARELSWPTPKPKGAPSVRLSGTSGGNRLPLRPAPGSLYAFCAMREEAFPVTEWVDRDVEFVRQRFDRLAPIYRLMDLLWLLPPGICAQGVEQLGLTHGISVLEVGCGTGRNLPALVKAVGPAGRVCGVDTPEKPRRMLGNAATRRVLSSKAAKIAGW